ncbi:DUF6907 domain-containing protein [Streptomyces sp. NPDC008121]|uniref:DUF6907 domain-containing protein n=1 Tax=Streptomyces sp. NPDC008121 TaxID=3364809 RepID=UPI0036E11976
MNTPDPLEGVPAELRDWHQGALDGDPAVCGAPQPMQPGYPCIWNKASHDPHRDVYGRTWPNRPEEPLYVAQPRERSAGGTVTVATRDHGGVTLVEPSWCAGHAGQAPVRRADIAHTGPEHSFAFEGEQLLVAMLTQRPLAEHGTTTTGLYVEQTGYARTLDPTQLRMLAAALTVHAMHLRTLAGELAALHAEEGRTP